MKQNNILRGDYHFYHPDLDPIKGVWSTQHVLIHPVLATTIFYQDFILSPIC